MRRHIVIIQGHPDATKHHYGHALAEAYAQGAQQAGHEVKTINVAELDFPLLRSYEEFYELAPPPIIQLCQDDIRWADHLVFIYPLWLGSMPALLKGFIEQVFRHGFAMEAGKGGKFWKKLLKGKSARIVITMGMPAFLYRWVFRAHSLKSLEKNVLKFCGIKPVRESLIGNVEGSAKYRERWLKKMEELGKACL
ncbi:MAG: NAD(P)H-dependent oxidoreductase [Granulosicoccaceae bacterium]|jgi:putative NADPH-quinone reductase